MEKNTFQKIYDVVREIPKGCVASYGQVAALAGNRRWARVVGYALNVSQDPALPCHRVVNREGRVSEAFVENGRNRQVILLEQEGVKCRDGKVDMSMYQWKKMIF
ncbi:MAG: MGMT family protein [Ruminococcus sp.]|jgi:methylated-DNA-protein-cysteine methyltransferase-like protein